MASEVGFALPWNFILISSKIKIFCTQVSASYKAVQALVTWEYSLQHIEQRFGPPLQQVDFVFPGVFEDWNLGAQSFHVMLPWNKLLN